MYEVPPTQSFQPPQLQLSTFKTHHHVCCLGASSAKLFVVCADHAKSRPDFVTLPRRTFHHCEKIFDDRTYQPLSFVFGFRLPGAISLLVFSSISILQNYSFSTLEFFPLKPSWTNKAKMSAEAAPFITILTSLYLAIKSFSQIESCTPVYVFTIGIAMSRFFHPHIKTQIRG